MNNPSEELRTLLGTFDKLVTARHFGHAYTFARVLAKDYSLCVESYIALSLACNLLNRHSEALAAHRQAEWCQGFTPEIDGDFYRDHTQWAIRCRQFDRARTYLNVARQRHEHSENRSACLDFVAGKLAYAQGDYWLALSLYAQAKRRWQQLADSVAHGSVTEPPNPQWRFNCNWHYFKAVSAVRPGSEVAKELRAELLQSMDKYGSQKYRARLELIWRLGKGGNKLDDSLIGWIGTK